MLPICNVRIKAEKPDYRQFPPETDKSLGACLKRQRLALEWTQKTTGNHFGVLKDSYQKWEWNEVIPDIKRRKKVIEFLGFNFWDDMTNSFANRTMLYRIEHAFNRKDLAELIGVSDSTIQRIEENESKCSNAVMIKVNDFIV